MHKSRLCSLLISIVLCLLRLCLRHKTLTDEDKGSDNRPAFSLRQYIAQHSSVGDGFPPFVMIDAQPLSGKDADEDPLNL